MSLFFWCHKACSACFYSGFSQIKFVAAQCGARTHNLTSLQLFEVTQIDDEEKKWRQLSLIIRLLCHLVIQLHAQQDNRLTDKQECVNILSFSTSQCEHSASEMVNIAQCVEALSSTCWIFILPHITRRKPVQKCLDQIVLVIPNWGNSFITKQLTQTANSRNCIHSTQQISNTIKGYFDT